MTYLLQYFGYSSFHYQADSKNTNRKKGLNTFEIFKLKLKLS